VRGGLTLSVSPVLAEQLAHSDFRDAFRGWSEERLETATAEVRRATAEKDRARSNVAAYWERFHRDSLTFFFHGLQGDLLGALRDLEETGPLELATCAATHAYLPLLGRDETIALELELARRSHERHFGRAPRGLWLPEMAYRPAGRWWPPTRAGHARDRAGLEEAVAAAGLKWFVLDSALLIGGRGVGSYPETFRDREDLREEAESRSRPHPEPEDLRDTRRPYWVARSEGRRPEVAFFPRDPRTSLQVWSAERGYPGDPAYLEFHKKSEAGGHRCWAVTGPAVDLADKALYDPELAAARVQEHAKHFANLVLSTLSNAPEESVLVSPFDAELFGHWWYEGVAWLEAVLNRLHDDPRARLVRPSEHLDEMPPETVVALPEGSWGQGGHHWVWHNPRVDWTWDLVHPEEDELWQLRKEALSTGNQLALRVTRAMARQLLILCASDWAFLITTDGAPDYAADRIRLHADDVARLSTLAREVLRGKDVPESEMGFLQEVETRDGLFPELEDALCEAAARGTASAGERSGVDR
jgi:1,4-alpha-glucan branching enzyme